MNDVLDILKYILPSGIVFLAVYFVLKAFLNNEQKRKLLEIKMKTLYNLKVDNNGEMKIIKARVFLETHPETA